MTRYGCACRAPSAVCTAYNSQCNNEDRDANLIAFSGPNDSNPPEPLGACTGECDEDGDCADGLVCSQERYDMKLGDSIPGCTGTGDDDESDWSLGWDYCFVR